MRSPPKRGALARIVPGVPSILSLDRSAWLREIGIGISVAAIAVPGGLALAQLIGLPPEAGLYACIAPALIYALVGPSSRYLIIGPDTATCMLIAASMAGLGANTPDARVGMVAALTMLVGLFCLAASAARLGLISSLISKAVLVGYLAGVAISLLVSQLSPLTGVDLESPGIIRPLAELVRRQSEVHWPTVAVGLLLFAILRLGKRFVPRLPVAILVILLAIASSSFLHFDARGIATVGAVPSGLPGLRVPGFDGDWSALVQAAAGIMVVSCSSGLITARAFGQQVGAPSRPNRELAGFGLANVAASLFQGFAVTGSDSRTAVAVSSGGRSALVGVVAALTVAFVALFLTAPIALLPHAALAAILASAAFDMFDVRQFVRLARIGRTELGLALIATAGVVWIGVLQGVIIAVAATLVHLVILAARPRDGMLERAPGSGDLVTRRRDPRARPAERILVYLFEASLFFVNADYFGDRVRLALRSRPDTEWFVLDASAMMYADSAAMEVLAALKSELDARGIGLLLGGGHGRFRESLDRSGVADLIGRDRIFTTAEGALAEAERLRDARAGQAGAAELSSRP